MASPEPEFRLPELRLEPAPHAESRSAGRSSGGSRRRRAVSGSRREASSSASRPRNAASGSRGHATSRDRSEFSFLELRREQVRRPTSTSPERRERYEHRVEEDVDGDGL